MSKSTRRADEQTIRWVRRHFREKLGLWEHAEVDLGNGQVYKVKKVSRGQEPFDQFLVKIIFRTAAIIIGAGVMMNLLHTAFAFM